MASYPHATEEGRTAIRGHLERVAGVNRQAGVAYDAQGRQVLDSLDAFLGWAREHNLAVVA